MKHFGLIGYPLSHSFSKNYFTEKFSREGITDCVYENYSIPDISLFTKIIESTPHLTGLNVTIPYKKDILSFLDDMDPVVASLGACNCLQFRDGRIKGYNTDVIGFRLALLEQLHPHHSKALVLGEGGAAKAVNHVLEELGIEYITVSRKSEQNSAWVSYDDLTNGLVHTHKLIINTTPVGTFPAIDECPHIPYHAIGNEHYLFDLIYNPAKSAFLKKGEEQGALTSNGLKMLIIQAEESWKIWSKSF